MSARSANCESRRRGVGVGVHRRPLVAPRPAYTLFELLLVLSLMLLLSGLAWTGFTSLYQRQRLREAADEVRARLAEARLQATETGEVMQFSFVPAGREYEFVSWEAAATAEGPAPGVVAELPETLRFELVGEGLRPETVAILFYPEGTATPAEWQIVDENEQAIRISIRDLTAAITVHQVQAVPQAQPGATP